MIGKKDKNRRRAGVGTRGQFHISRRKPKAESLPNPKKLSETEPEREGMLEAPHDMLIGAHSADNLLSWRAPEFEKLERDKRWYMMMAIALIGIVAYAIWVDGLIMAITFILIGAVGYIYIHKSPRIMNFMITEDGIVAGKEIYDFSELKSFWIFYEPASRESAERRIPDGYEGGWVKILSLHTKSLLLPYVHIPIHDQDPSSIREILLEFIPEEKHEAGAVETLERLLRL